MKIINAQKAPKAVGPYSHAVVQNGLIFLSGQVGLIPETGELIAGDITVQTKQALTNLKTVLEEAGSSLEKVISTSCFLKSMQDFQSFNEVYGEFFGDHKPARTTVEVSNLPKGAVVEINMIAML